MPAKWLVFIWTMLLDGVSAASDELTDFSNNLATDLAPLIVLFGEPMTKQYLSESTLPIDYFIFAMGPIGILTAVVSTIRVCGSPALRAFVGRSQEGDAVVEAELCTSTSRDVCELFNKGGITRVLGRPKILELFYAAGKVSILRHYLPQGGEGAQWTKTTESERRERRINHEIPLAPMPNLSLNVGIKKRPLWVFRAIAALGLVLQLGAIAFAGVGTWFFGWSLTDGQQDSSSASDAYAPSMYIVGTIVMCAGMFSCAALIGESTHEVRYRRGEKDGLADRGRLIWLQPGPQVVGDQNFDAFSYFEDKQAALEEWISSTKDLGSRLEFELYTWAAILAVLGGYIVQFIGLRGMKAWVSIAQLGITVLMSILRGLLRVQRLPRDSNRLGKMPDLIPGHELDWLAFQLASNHEEKAATQLQKESGRSSPSSGLICPFSFRGNVSAQQGAPTRQDTSAPYSIRPYSPDHQPSQSSPTEIENAAERLLSLRAQLGRLTGTEPFYAAELGNKEYQAWGPDLVLVRKKALQVSSAICLAMEKLPIDQSGYFTAELSVASSVEFEPRAKSSEHEFKILLRRTQMRWHVESATIEAILGLWHWSLISDKRLIFNDEAGNASSRAERVRRFRIVAAEPCSLESQGESHASYFTDTLRNARLWYDMRPSARREGIFDIDNSSLTTLWFMEGGEHGDAVTMLNSHHCEDNKSKFWPGTVIRFSGMLACHDVIRSERSKSVDRQCSVRLGLVAIDELGSSLLDACGQELFAVLIRSLAENQDLKDEVAKVIDAPEVKMVARGDTVRLENEAVDALADAFVSAGLGGREDALQCIVPALWKDMAITEPKQLLRKAVDSARAYRRMGQWAEACQIMIWIVRQFSQLRLPRFYLRARREMFELYRWSFSLHSGAKRVDTEALKWMLTEDVYTKPKKREHNREFQQAVLAADKLRNHYFQVASRYEQIGGLGDDDDVFDTRDLTNALDASDRPSALYHLGRLSREDVKKQGPKSQGLICALCLAVQNGFVEIVDTLLQLGVDSDKPNGDGIKPLAHADFSPAQQDDGQIVELLLATEENVDVNVEDSNGKTPLSKALEHEQRELALLLLRNGANYKYIEQEDHPIVKEFLAKPAQRISEKASEIFLESRVASVVGETLGTAFVTRDIEALFESLDKDGLIRCLGYSYGTLLGPTVAAMYKMFEKFETDLDQGKLKGKNKNGCDRAYSEIGAGTFPQQETGRVMPLEGDHLFGFFLYLRGRELIGRYCHKRAGYNEATQHEDGMVEGSQVKFM